ncbi:MAG TPA: ABC transporter substrate-binding protein [Methylomirabilota bacterium]|nr:ABC transporter substrate-binding protein [Methylomirabilota bacterium]
MLRRSSVVLGVLVTLVAVAPSRAQTLRPQPVKIAVSTTEPHNLPLWVARDRKIFDKYGLDVELIFVGGGTLVAQMLAAGEIQIASAAPASLVSLIAGGEKIAVFLGLSNTSPFTLVAQPSIKSAADLKGKRLGTARFGGSSHTSALIALDHLGLDAKRDNITILQTGLDPERVAALERKALDAAMLQRLATKMMLGKGYTALLDLHAAKIPYQNNVLAARRDFVTGQPQVGENFTRAVVEAFAYIFDRENKQAVKDVIAKTLKLRSADDAEDFYLEAQEGLDRKPYPTPEGTRTVIKYVAERNPKVASLKVEEIIDTSWLKRLDHEGFFDKVHGGR